MTRLQFLLLVLLMATIGLAIALIAHRVDTLDAQLRESQADRKDLHAKIDDERAAAQALKEQVERLGGKPVAEPGEPNQGAPGPGPTAAQVRAAVADYCIGDRCAPTVTRSQVAAAIADYCAGGTCKGRDGKDGGAGADGADGTNGTDGTDGATGPGPTDEQIAAAVADYCADGRCNGEPGKDGADGKDATFTESGMDCPDGERVNGVHLLADGSLTVSCAPLIGRD